MKKLIKLSHIEMELSGGFQLKDFNLSIGSGEIIHLVANTDVEKYLIKDILTGVNEKYKGSFYFGNRKQVKWNQKSAYDNGIFYVDERQQLAYKLNVMENVCAIRKTDSLELIIHKSHVRKRTKELLDLVGLHRRPDDYIEHFTHFERQLVCIAKMLYHGAKLLIIDGFEHKYNLNEIRHMKNLVGVLAGMDIAILFLQRQPEELLSVCTKCVLMRDGSDGKILFPPEITKEIIGEYRYSYSCEKLEFEEQHTAPKKRSDKFFLVRNKNGEEHQYQIIGYYDMDLDSNIHFREYLQNLNVKQIQISLEGISLENMLENQEEMLMIGNNSVEDLLYNLNLGENLAVTFRYMEKQGRLLMNHRFCTYLRTEFLRKFEMEKDAKQLDELSYYEKKLLSIYRWLQVGNVKSIFFEEPYQNLQDRELEGMKQYLLEIYREHAPIGIFSKNVFDLMQICDAIIVSCQGRFIKHYDKMEFDDIIADTVNITNGGMGI